MVNHIFSTRKKLGIPVNYLRYLYLGNLLGKPYKPWHFHAFAKFSSLQLQAQRPEIKRNCSWEQFLSPRLLCNYMHYSRGYSSFTVGQVLMPFPSREPVYVSVMRSTCIFGRRPQRSVVGPLSEKKTQNLQGSCQLLTFFMHIISLAAVWLHQNWRKLHIATLQGELRKSAS